MTCIRDSMENDMVYQMILVYLLTGSHYGVENTLQLEVSQY